ncbi:pantoate--beta-alanine ligase [Thiolapillus sp.]
MKRVESIAQLRQAVSCLSSNLALVPTMGNLHEGHLALVRRARELAGHVVVSIFVNPLQFDRKQDLQAYPRTLDRDLELLREEGVDLVFTPPETAVYPGSMAVHTRVEVPGVSDVFCGQSRPGHFVGVSTIVCKLLNMVQPRIAVFGKKDFQQLLIIKRMVEDLAMPVDIVGVDTVREPDGLAMSSRNNYLDTQQRQIAPALYHALKNTVDALKQGARDFPALEHAALEQMASAGLQPDYFHICRADDLGKPEQNERKLVILGAAFLGMARLIDNLEVHL